MYVPPAFSEDRLPVLFDAMDATSLPVLVSHGREGLFATHLPLLLDRQTGPQGTLLGHLARANPQWRDLAAGAEAMVIFAGPDAYVTPAWYAAKAEHGRVVPTWNYVTVHAWGTVEVVDEPMRLRDLVARLTDRHEAASASPWQVDDAPPSFIAGQLKGITGVVITITRISGKWKLSQNRATEDKNGVISGLNARDKGNDAEVSRLMMPLGS